jgi:hypothetical protein
VGVQDIVKSAVAQTPRTTTRPIPSVSGGIRTPALIKAEQETKQIQQPLITQAISQPQATAQITAQLTRLTQRERGRQRTAQIIKITEVTTTKQGLAQTQLLKKIQQPKQRVVPAFVKLPSALPTRPPILPFSFKILAPKPTGRIGTFGVEVKGIRGFVPVGRGLTLGRAVSVGARRTRETPATIFRVRQERAGRVRGGFQLPKGFKQKKGLVFIEQPKLKLQRIKI